MSTNACYFITADQTLSVFLFLLILFFRSKENSHNFLFFIKSTPSIINLQIYRSSLYTPLTTDAHPMENGASLRQNSSKNLRNIGKKLPLFLCIVYCMDIKA